MGGNNESLELKTSVLKQLYNNRVGALERFFLLSVLMAVYAQSDRPHQESINGLTIETSALGLRKLYTVSYGKGAMLPWTTPSCGALCTERTHFHGKLADAPACCLALPSPCDAVAKNMCRGSSEAIPQQCQDSPSKENISRSTWRSHPCLTLTQELVAVISISRSLRASPELRLTPWKYLVKIIHMFPSRLEQWLKRKGSSPECPQRTVTSGTYPTPDSEALCSFRCFLHELRGFGRPGQLWSALDLLCPLQLHAVVRRSFTRSPNEHIIGKDVQSKEVW